jgi:hypothetical protein
MFRSENAEHRFPRILHASFFLLYKNYSLRIMSLLVIIVVNFHLKNKSFIYFYIPKGEKLQELYISLLEIKFLA